MKRITRMLGSNRCLGVYAGVQRVSWATISNVGNRAHPDGTGVKDVESEARAAQVIGEVVAQHVAMYGRASPIVIGLPAERAYLVGLTDAQAEEATTPETGAVRGGYFRPGAIESMVFDVAGHQRSLLAIAACPNDHVKGLIAACNAAGANDVRIEPVAKALSEQVYAVARKGKLRLGSGEHVIHLLQSEGSCLALWSRGAMPLGCRTLREPEGVRPSLEALFTALRGMEVYGAQRLKLGIRPQVVLHGVLGEPALVQQLSRMLDLRISAVSGVDGSATALALAMARSARRRRVGECDLGKGGWAPGPLISFVPLREAAAVLAASVLMTISMWWSVWAQQSRASALERANQANTTLNSATESELRAERISLEEETNAVRRFVLTRRIWTNTLAEVANRIPPTARIDGLLGQDELTTGLGKAEKRVKRQLLVDYSCPFPMNSAVPHEVEEALDLLRAAPPKALSFPAIELATLRLDRNKAAAGDADKAKFSVLCRPKAGAL